MAKDAKTNLAQAWLWSVLVHAGAILALASLSIAVNQPETCVQQSQMPHPWP